MIKKIFAVLLMILLLVGIFNINLITYGVEQAYGQLKIVFNAKSVEEILDNPDYPDSIKYKLNVIKEVRSFAFDSLGLKHSDNYTTFYDQGGKPLMWVVSACAPYKLEAYEWSFPIIGTFSYKGFFNYNRAVRQENVLKEKGLDTNIRTAGGWSTLGWLTDPVLSGMLKYDEAELCELIIHELTHGTLFVKDSLMFNENLASFVGKKGTEMFLKAKYGAGADILNAYKMMNEDIDRVHNHIIKGAQFLDDRYNNMNENLSDEEKKKVKFASIQQIMDSIDTLSLHDKKRYRDYYQGSEWNNTFFMSYLRYRGYNELLEKELEHNYKGNLYTMLSEYKLKYHSL